MVLRLQRILIFVSAICTSTYAFASNGAIQAVQQFPLDEHIVYQIPIGQDVPTTIMFPSALMGIEGANVSGSLETPAPVLLAYTPGRNYFSIRATETSAKAAINVVWKNRTFVLRFATGTEPYGSVTFYEDNHQSSRPSLETKRVTPQKLLELLDQAKNLSILSAINPTAVRDVAKSEPGTITLYRDFRVIVQEVYRFNREDTLVFRVRLENSGEKEVIYQPQRLAVRVADHVYYASIADASGIIPPKAVTFAFFAITGTPRGERAELSLKNTFSIIVPRVERDAKLIISK